MLKFDKLSWELYNCINKMLKLFELEDKTGKKINQRTIVALGNKIIRINKEMNKCQL